MYQNYRNLLNDFISKKSISTDANFASEIQKTADWLSETFKSHGFTSEVVQGFGNPLVYASYVVDPSLPSTLVYGHYDVQPAKKEDGWDADPFTIVEKDGKLIARGIVDNKGQVLIHTVAVFNLIDAKKLTKNVIFLIEGDEETGNTGVGKWLRENHSKLNINEVLISDGEMPYKPMITASFRGTFNSTVKVKTADNNLHSGLYGGAVPSAVEELATFVSKLHNDNYETPVVGFYDGQTTPSVDEKKLSAQLDIEREKVLAHTGIKKFFTDESNGFSLKTGFVTMVTTSGFKGGYIDSGYSNIVPSTAEARFNFRIAAESDPVKIWKSFKDFARKEIPDYVEVTFSEPESIVHPIKVDVTSPLHQKTIDLLEEVYGDKVLIDYCGATIPFVVDIKEVLNVDPLLVSLANDDCNMHGVNENYDIELIKKGLEFSQKYFS